MEWGDVLDKLNDVKKSGRLDEHQEGLARLIRYNDNWRLRETALEYAADVKKPTDALLKEIVKTLIDDAAYYDARILAAAALGVLGARMEDGNRGRIITKDLLLESLRGVAANPAPPILKEAAKRSIARLQA